MLTLNLMMPLLITLLLVSLLFNKSHVLLFLLFLELAMLSSLFLLFMSLLNLSQHTSFLIPSMLAFTVCEASIGLACLVSISHSPQGTLMKALTPSQW